jgi:hypothetical protein
MKIKGKKKHFVCSYENSHNCQYMYIIAQIQASHVLMGNNSTVTAIDFDNEGVRLMLVRIR